MLNYLKTEAEYFSSEYDDIEKVCKMRHQIPTNLQMRVELKTTAVFSDLYDVFATAALNILQDIGLNTNSDSVMVKK